MDAVFLSQKTRGPIDRALLQEHRSGYLSVFTFRTMNQSIQRWSIRPSQTITGRRACQSAQDLGPNRSK